MLARLARELPRGDFLYEPKWDGFRCLAEKRGDSIELTSRHAKPFARYFPELVRALSRVRGDFIVDGEIVIVGPGGFDFAALMNRTHPAASRVERLARETPATFIAFDLISVEESLLERTFVERRRALEELLRGAPPAIRPTPITEDPAVAEEWLERYRGGGVDGVVAKERSLRYQPGKRAMLKVKHERTADCVVAGFRLVGDGSQPLVSSLLLGLRDGDALVHVGVASQFTRERRQELLRELRPLLTRLQGHPWEHGFNLGRLPMGRLPGSAGRWDPAEMALDWIPLRPERVCEVAYDHLDGVRFRHPGRFRRWRPDREPSSCGFDQLACDLPDAVSLGLA